MLAHNGTEREERAMRELTGKVAVVTGGASGIGRAMAERFAREGMKIVLADVEAQPLARTRDEMAAAGAEVLAVKTDVSRAEDVTELARRTFEAFGTAHVVCNNAGVAAGGGAAWRVSPADWEWTLGVNLWGVIHGVRAFVPRMVEQGEGHVINTASIAGLVAVPGLAPYCVSKSAVVALSESLHHDLTVNAGGKVKVSVLCPAWVKTKISESERNRPQSSAGQPEDDARGQAVASAVRAAVASGIPPEVVASKVLDAIHNDRFWIITHSKTKRMIENRGRGILEDVNPEFDPYG
jgi:NAD(P)-dependent dehydrogenase (short-subunit alcohol dehydrogenase family)